MESDSTTDAALPSDPPSSAASRVAARCVILAILAAVFWIGGRAAEDQLSTLRIGVDDANIYFRYGRNIANGFGCVWNPGGERVEGCTSPSWVAVCAIGFLATPTPEAAFFATSVVLAALASWIAALGIARMLDPGRSLGATLAAGIAVAAWIVASPCHVVWMTATLMDTPIWTAAIVVAWSAALAWTDRPESLRRRVAFGAALALLAFARPEGPAVASILLVGAAFKARSGKRSLLASMRRLALTTAIFVGAVAAMLIMRWMYFGQWLPNTYYAKVDGDFSVRVDSGLEYLASFVRAFPVACLAAAIGCGVALARGRSAAPVLAMALLVFAAVNVVFVGGDHFGSWRILQPYWLLLLVPIMAPLSALPTPAWRSAFAVAIAVALSGLTVLLGPITWDRLTQADSTVRNFCMAEGGRALGMAFNDMFPPGERPVVGVYAAGGFGFAYEGISFDVLGLNDVEMAHARGARLPKMPGHGGFHAATFFRRAPDLLLAYVAACPTASPRPPGDRIPYSTLGPEDSHRFDEIFVPVAIATESSYAQGMMMPAWARRDWLARNAGRIKNVRELVPAGDGWTYR